MNLRTHLTPAVGRVATVLTAAIAFSTVPAIAFAAPAPSTPVKLVVDPGHGGKDPGAVGGRLLEKDSALQISNLIVESAKRQGWTVAMTRSDDRFIELNQRPAKANAMGADAFISVHSNSAGDRPLGHMTINRNEASRNLGDSIMKELDPLTPYEDIGNRKDERGLAVLRGADMPAVLVEFLSVSSTQEREVLRNGTEQKKMAEAVVKGIAANKGVEYKAPEAPATPKAEPVAEPTVTPDAEPTVTPKPAPKAAPTRAPEADPTAKAEPTADKAETEPRAETRRADTSIGHGVAPLSRFGAMLRALFR